MPEPSPSPAPRDAARRVVASLQEAGHVAYFAGGCVRDEVLGLHPADYDVATDATPRRVQQLFRRTAHVGMQFGVVLVHEQGHVIEVATFRCDGPYSDRRRPDQVTFADAETDARRRDFTINALFLDPLAADEAGAGAPIHGHVVDFVGGLDDLARRIIRAVGDPDKRLDDDHLRALRAVRFAARLDFAVEPATAEAIRRHAASLQGVSRERIGDEIRRMILHPSRRRAMELLTELDLDGHILTEAPRPGVACLALGAVEVPDDTDTPQAVACHLAAWALDRRAPAGRPLEPAEVHQITHQWRRALCLSNAESEALAVLLHGHHAIVTDWPGLSVARRKRAAASWWFDGALRLTIARHPALADTVATDVARLAATPAGLAPAPFVDGRDLLALGVIAGPRFRTILDRLYDAQLEGCVGSRRDALALARTLMEAPDEA